MVEILKKKKCELHCKKNVRGSPQSPYSTFLFPFCQVWSHKTVHDPLDKRHNKQNAMFFFTCNNDASDCSHEPNDNSASLREPNDGSACSNKPDDDSACLSAPDDGPACLSGQWLHLDDGSKQAKWWLRFLKHGLLTNDASACLREPDDGSVDWWANLQLSFVQYFCSHCVKIIVI